MALAAKERMRIYCPTQTRAAFEGIRATAAKLFERALKEKNGCPSAILFSETALRYRFDALHEGALRAIEQMQKDMPGEIPVAVAFNVMQLDGGGPENRGYIFGKNSSDSSPKRHCTFLEDLPLARYFGREIAKAMKEKWDADGDKMSQLETPFASHVFPDGQKLEYRLCKDIFSKPLCTNSDAIAIVSARGLGGYGTYLGSYRSAVVVNDAWRNSPEAYPKERSSIAAENGFYSVSLYDSGFLPIR